MAAVRSPMCVFRRGAVSWRSRPSWWWAERSRSRSARSPRRATASSPTRSPARSRACAFDLGDGDIVIVGGGQRDGVEVQRSERSSFGHTPVTERTRARQRLRREVALPDRRCSGPARVGYRVVVPDNVAVDVRTTGGRRELPRLPRQRAGADRQRRDRDRGLLRQLARRPRRLAATSPSTPTARRRGSRCARTSGTIRAADPARPYDLDAESSAGDERVRGVTATSDAPYSVQVLSTSGDVFVEGRS